MTHPQATFDGRPGIAMILVLGVVAMVSVIGLSVTAGLPATTNASNNLIDASRAAYLAESGLVEAEHRFIHPAEGEDYWTGVTNRSVPSMSGTYTVTVTEDGENEYEVVSTGRIAGRRGGEISRTVRMRIRVTETGPKQSGLTVQSRIRMEQQSVIAGISGDAEVRINSRFRRHVRLSDDAQVHGNLYLPPNSLLGWVVSVTGDALITGVTETLEELAEVPTIVHPDGNDFATFAGDVTYGGDERVVISSDLYADELTIEDSAVLVISGDVTMVVDDDFVMDDDARIELEDGATLTLHVRQKVELFGEAELNADADRPESVEINSVGNQVNLGDDARLSAIVNGPIARLSLKDDAHASGAFVVDEVRMTDSTEVELIVDVGGGGSGGDRTVLTLDYQTASSE